jgi:hypothetical protein
LDRIKRANVWVIRVQEGLENVKGVEILFKEIIIETFITIKGNIFRYRKVKDHQSSTTQPSLPQDFLKPRSHV